MKKILLLAAGALLASSASAANWAVVGAYSDPSWNFEASTVLEGTGNELSCTIDHLISGFKIVDIDVADWSVQYGTSTPIEVGETYVLQGKDGGDDPANIEFAEGLLAINNAVVTWNPTTFEMEITGEAVTGLPTLYVTGGFCSWAEPGSDKSLECTEEDGIYTVTFDLGESGSEFKLAGEGWSNEIAGGVTVGYTPVEVTKGGNNLFTLLTGEQTLVFDYNTMMMNFVGEAGEEPEPEDVIYLVGAPQGWNIAGASMPLANIEEGVYSGLYNIEEGNAIFRFYTQLGNWDANSIGSQVEDSPISITLADGAYSGACVEGKGSWEIAGWEGGLLKMTVDLNKMTVDFVVPGEMAYEPTITPESGTTFYNSYSIPNVEISWYEVVKTAGEYATVYLAYEKEDAQPINAYVQASGYMDGDEWVEAPPYSLVIDWSQYASNPDDYSTKTGEYTITVPAGVVSNEDGEINSEIVLTYTVYTSKPEDLIEPDPYDTDDSGNPVTFTSEELDDVTVSFPAELKAVANPPQVTATRVAQQTGGIGGDFGGGIMPLDLDLPEGYTVVIDPSLIKIEGNDIVLDLSGLKRNGEWFIVIPAGYAQINATTYTGEVTITYNIENEISTFEATSVKPVDGTVMYGWPLNVVVSYDEEIAGISEPIKVSVSYNDGEAVEVNAVIQDNGAYDETEDKYVPAAPYDLVVNWESVALGSEGLQAGEYVITIPAGIIDNAEGDLNEEIELTYTLYNAKGWEEITPDPFDMDEEFNPVTYTSEELAEVVVSFDIENNLTAVTPAPAVTVLLQGNDDENQGGVSPLAIVDEDGVLDPSLIKVEGKNIVLDLSGLEEGTWFIEIPAGFAKINDTTYTNVVEITYNVSNGTVTVLGEPELIGGLQNYATYTTNNVPEYALLTWDFAEIELGEGDVTVEIEDRESGEITDLTISADDLVLRFAVPAQEGGEPDPLTRAEDEEEVYNALEIVLGEDFQEAITGAAYVTISIPEGLVVSGEAYNEAYDIYFDIMPVFEGTPVITNNDGDVSIIFEGYGVYVNSLDADAAYVSDSEGNQIDLSYASPYEEEGETADVTEIIEDVEIDGDVYPDFVGVLVRLNNLDLEDGNYTLWLPLGYLTVHTYDYAENWVSDVIYWAFKVEDGMITGATSAIDSINANTAIEGVYNLQGVKMSNDINSLQPGLYIINGKKVLIRK